MQSLRIAAALALLSAGCAPPPDRHMAALRSPNVTTPAAAHQKPEAPVLKKKKNGRFRVAKPWNVEVGGRIWTVEKNYTCNGITAPDKIKARLGNGVDQPETWAAVFHDWLFTQPGMTREKADRLFYQLLIAYGVSPLKARLMYSTVSAYSASKALR